MRLPFKTPFRFDSVLAFLATRAIDGIDRVANGRYERRVLEDTVTVEREDDYALRVSGREYEANARRMFDLDADPVAIDKHLAKDVKLRPLVRKRPGTRVPGAWEPFEVAVRAVVGQQITVRAATTIMHRIVAKFGGFPTPRQLADADIAGLGMPRARITTISTIARAVADNPAILTRGKSLDESIDRLESLRGIGPWTAHYIAMRALREPDAFPHSDLGLMKAAAAIGIDRLLDHAERWRPYRAYAAIALWESL